VRRHCVLLREKFIESKLIVHLEDNEEVLLVNDIPMTMEELLNLPDKEICIVVPEKRIHPVFYKEFLRSADGITVIMDTLSEFIPENKKNIVLWPAADTAKFFPGKMNFSLKSDLGISEDEMVVCYTGNVHVGNAKEVRSLYLAIALANREGVPARLIRTGRDYCNFLGEPDEWARKYSIELGVIEYERIPLYLSISDVLIQPGKSNIFNDYRLPSKIPEFLLMGKPVAVPDTNIGRFLKNNDEAIILKKGDALEILEVIKKIKADRAFADKLSEQGRSFALKFFSSETNAVKLEQFYMDLNGKKVSFFQKLKDRLRLI